MMGRGHFNRIAESKDERARNIGNTLLRLLGYLKPYKAAVVGSFALILVSAASQGLSPYLVGRIIDTNIAAGGTQGLAVSILILAGVYVAGAVATRYQTYAMSWAGQKLLADLRQRVFDHIQSLSLQYLEGKQSGELMSRLTNDIDAMNNFISQGLAQMVGALFSLVGVAVAMVSISPLLGLSVLVLVPVMLLITRFFTNMARRAYRRTRTTIGDVSAELEEEISGIKVAQAFNRTGYNIRKFMERNAANRDANINATAITSAFGPTMDVLGAIDTAIVAAFGGILVVRGMTSVGVVVAFIQYVQNFFRPIQMITQMWTLAQSAIAAAERVFELLDTEPKIKDVPGARDLPQIEGRIEVKNVTFQYDDDDHPVLEDVSLETKPGQMIAIVGPTGAGKTTIASLIARFYEPTKGDILIDGYNLKSVTQRSLRSQMGIVTQEPFLFSGTVMDNIRYGKIEAGDDQVIQAARAVHVHDFIQSMPEGYNTQVGERGKILSQGQRQLITIARALLAGPKILIMDEATSSVDTQTEVIIQKAMNRLLKGRTSLVIAHRLSTVRNADIIIVIDDGKIVEKGAHDDLLARNGLYAELYNKQLFNLDTDEKREGEKAEVPG